MRALRRCDFCADDAIGTFEVVPPELEPTDAEQRRVILCEDCSGRLETLLEPLFDRLGADGAVSDDGGTATVSCSIDHDGGDESAADDPDGGVGANGDATGVVTDGTTTESATDDTTGSRSIEGITVENDHASASETGDSRADEGELPRTVPEDSVADSDSAPDERTDSDIDTTTTGDTDELAAPDRESRSDGTSTRPPTAYRNVVRLLRNREFPMERDAVESLAAGAYDLENHEVERIVDYAIENGEFVEDGGKLRRS